MDTHAYERHWVVFDLVARPVMDAVRTALLGHGLPASDVSIDERGEERSLAIELRRGERAVFVDLLLLDGDESGFGPDRETGEPQVAVKLVVEDETGIEHFSYMPLQFSAGLGVSTPQDLVRRVFTYFEPTSIADVVQPIAINRFRAPEAEAAANPVLVAPSMSYGACAPSM